MGVIKYGISLRSIKIDFFLTDEAQKKPNTDSELLTGFMLPFISPEGG
jgi:hypothetical protein